MAKICDCGHTPTVSPVDQGVGTGYGTDAQGKTWCYECCAYLDKAEMIEEGKITLYLTVNPGPYVAPSRCKITNWPGTLEFRPTIVRKSQGRGFHGLKFEIVHVWFTGPDGLRWIGRNAGHHQLLHCRRLKG